MRYKNLGVEKIKKAYGRVKVDAVERQRIALRGAIDRPTFMRSKRWSDFRSDCEVLVEVMTDKETAMRSKSTSEVERRARTATSAATPTASTIEPAGHTSESKRGR